MDITIDITGYLQANFCEVHIEDGKAKSDPTKPLTDERSKEILEALQNGDMTMGLVSRQVFPVADWSNPVCGVDFDVGDMDYTFSREACTHCGENCFEGEGCDEHNAGED